MKSIHKEKGKYLKAAATLVLALSWGASTLSAQSGEATFKSTCSACHSIGEGKRVGPDLKGVNERRTEAWLLNFIKSPQKMIGSDPDAKALSADYPMVMPDQALSDAQIKEVLTFIAGSASAPVAKADSNVVPQRASAEATIAEINSGRDLFTGAVSMTNGGASCLSCHNVNYTGVVPGGLLAKDLTEAYVRVGEDAGLMAILGSPPFPAMQQAYADHKLTEQEVFALTAFLNKVNTDKAGQIAQSNPLLLGGAAGVVVIFGMIFLLWSKRKTSTVKRAIYKRQVISK